MPPLWLIPIVTIAVQIVKQLLPDKYKKLLPWIATGCSAASSALIGHDPVTGGVVGLAAVGGWETIGKLIRGAIRTWRGPIDPTVPAT